MDLNCGIIVKGKKRIKTFDIWVQCSDLFQNQRNGVWNTLCHAIMKDYTCCDCNIFISVVFLFLQTRLVPNSMVPTNTARLCWESVRENSVGVLRVSEVYSA